MLGVKSYAELLAKTGDDRVIIEELVKLKLIHLGKCSVCRRNRVLTHSTNFRDNFAARCPKCRKFFPLSKTKGFFVETQLSIKNILQILYCWSSNISQHNCKELTRLSKASINQWYRYCRDIASWKLLQDKDQFIFGGPGRIVQIDESVISKRKYNRGRRVSLKWVLGIYDTTEKRGLVMHVEKRDQETLLPIIEEHVRPGTELWTDQWGAYNKLSELGYIHKTVNHSKQFKDPQTGVCTNQVEGYWSVLKRSLRRNTVNHSKWVEEHIDEFMWRKTYLKPKVNALDTLLQQIAEKYSS